MSVQMNHLISGVFNPFSIGVLLVCLGLLLYKPMKFRRTSIFFLIGAIIWFWFWSSRAVIASLGYWLESRCPPVAIKDIPVADVVCVLGGGMHGQRDWHPYAEMNAGADRVWQGARLYKAGKAKKILISGPGCRTSTIPLLLDLGVPVEDIVHEESAGNTEEEGRLVGLKVREIGGRKLLLVTSAWHMRRAFLMFSRCGLDVVPVGSDYEFMSEMPPNYSLTWRDFLPDAGSLSMSCVVFKEYFAYYAYKWFRGY